MQGMSSQILSAIDDAGHQIKMCFEGLPAAQWDVALATGLMTPKQTLTHLYEVYQAFLTEAAGGKHDWGTYQVPAEVAENPQNFAWEKRSEVRKLVEADPSEKNCHLAMDFIVLHDAYHVGQICAQRVANDPDFNPYSIYKHA